MGLIERISTLLRANLNDLIEQSDDPEKMIKQVIVDMQEQLVQVKTQLAVSIADLKHLERKAAESGERMHNWMRKAELAVAKDQDDIARSALERYQSQKALTAGLDQQVSHQKSQVEEFKSGLRQLEQKLSEAEARRDILIARHHRVRAASKVSAAKAAFHDHSHTQAFERMKTKVDFGEALSQVSEELAAEQPDAEVEKIVNKSDVEVLLRELKARRDAGTT